VKKIEGTILTTVLFMYRVDGGAFANTFNPGPHKAGSKRFPVLVDRNGNFDKERNKMMISTDSERFKAYFDRSEPFKFIKNGPTIVPNEVGFISYKVLFVTKNNVATEIGSFSWNRLEGRWKASSNL